MLRVICTHMHPDHIGLAHWLHGALAMPPLDQRHRLECRARGQHAPSAMRTAAMARPTSIALHGLTDPLALAEVRARSNFYASLVRQVPATGSGG